MHIYLAGPLFSLAERQFNAQLTKLLREMGHEVWLPQEHERPDKSARKIFSDDVEAIRKAKAVVANMDGPDPDSGTSWECGYAYGTAKPLLVFRTDFRVADKRDRAPFNPMLAESASRPPLDFSSATMPEMAEAIDRGLKKLATTSSSYSGRRRKNRKRARANK
jgi:nucleoside 2-deoxyribosyltransferase